MRTAIAAPCTCGRDSPYRAGEVSQPTGPTASTARLPVIDDGGWHTHGALAHAGVDHRLRSTGWSRSASRCCPSSRGRCSCCVSLQGLDQELQAAAGPIDMYVDYVRVYQHPLMAWSTAAKRRRRSLLFRTRLRAAVAGSRATLAVLRCAADDLPRRLPHG